MWGRSLGPEDALEKEMATHSNILVWKIPWTEEPDATKGLDMTKHAYFILFFYLEPTSFFPFLVWWNTVDL